MKRVYLAGLIAADCPETFKWRAEAESLLSGWFEVLTPMRGKDGLEERSKDGGLTDSISTSKDIILRDHADVRSTDLILANLELYGSRRPMVGTLMELAWAWEQRIPVLAIAASNNYLMRQHPFVCEAVSHYFKTVLDACTFAKSYYA